MARIVIPGCPHHLAQRGSRREDVLFTAATYGQWGRGEKNSILGYRFKIEQFDALAGKAESGK